MRIKLLTGLLWISTAVMAQQDTTDLMDYSQFGDAEGVKRFCNQKVLNQTPTRIVSLGYEYQGGFEMPSIPLSAMLPAMRDFQVARVDAIRAQVNIPVISTNSVIWQLGANYWGSRFHVEDPGTNTFAKALNTHYMTSAGINTTIFKPLNEKNFLILQATADFNGIFHELGDVSSKALTFGAVAIYGWKTSEKNMIGTGISRTYRAGRTLLAPVLLWNRTFNDRWGMELLLPARGHLRYNLSTSSMLQMGFELEGNQFWMNLANSPAGEVWLQRGELKPRIMWDKKIAGFIWLNAQAGLRYNWRFDAMNVKGASEDKQRYFTSNLGNPLYFAFGISLVSP